MTHSISHTIVLLSNIFYIFLAIWLFQNHLHIPAACILLIACVSILFHIFPDSKSAELIDIIVANTVILFLLVYFLPKYKENHALFLMLAFLAFSVGVILFYSSGDDHESTKYIVMHSLWHLLTALSLYFLAKTSIDTKTMLKSKSISLYPYNKNGF